MNAWTDENWCDYYVCGGTLDGPTWMTLTDAARAAAFRGRARAIEIEEAIRTIARPRAVEILRGGASPAPRGAEGAPASTGPSDDAEFERRQILLEDAAIRIAERLGGEGAA